MDGRISCVSRMAFLALGAAAILLLPGTVLAHCDTLDGPVVTDAKQALEKGDVTPVLKWVTKENEGEVRKAFEKALAVRSKGPEAKELADLWFFETLVRLHRAGEGAPYTGLKPAGAAEPIVTLADKALEGGSVDGLAVHVGHTVANGIRKRFGAAAEAKKHADESVEKGRAFVGAYIEFVHYVERLNNAAAASAAHHEPAAQPAAEPHHKAAPQPPAGGHHHQEVKELPPKHHTE